MESRNNFNHIIYILSCYSNKNSYVHKLKSKLLNFLHDNSERKYVTLYKRLEEILLEIENTLLPIRYYHFCDIP